MEYRQSALEGMEGLNKVDTKFWANKKVLITGYEGFLGSHLAKALIDLGVNIWGLDILTNRQITILSKDQLDRINITKASVDNLLVISRLIKTNRIEIIFHL